MNKFVTSSVLVGILSVGSLAWAEDVERGVSTPTHGPASPSVRVKIREQKDQFRQNVKDIKINTKTEIKDARTQLKNTTGAVRADVKKRKEEFNNTVKIKREKLQNEIKTKRENLKARLEKIKDERKKETVERIDQRIDVLNDKMMRHFSGVLDKLEEMLIRISERADKMTVERGLDVSAIRSAIDKANMAIASARSAIETQSGKTYTINITTENALKTDVGKARQALGADLVKVKDVVKAAHSAVRDAAVALAQLIIKINISPSLSETPFVTPTPPRAE